MASASRNTRLLPPLAGFSRKVPISALVPGTRTGNDARHKDITEVQKLIIYTVTVVQRFARDLRPSILDDHGLTPALASFLDHFTESTGIPTQFSLPN